MHSKPPEDSRSPEPHISTVPASTQSSPRQPNDRDESVDSQVNPVPREEIKQAAADQASGQRNTDLYERPSQNPKNNAPATPSPKQTQKLPDGREK